MKQRVLLVDGDERRRRGVAAELYARGASVIEGADVLAAMESVEGAALGAVVLAETRRLASLRALCLLARRRHPCVRLIVLAPAVVEPRTVEASFGMAVDVLDDGAPPGGIAAEVLALMARPLAFSIDPASTDKGPRPFLESRADSLAWRRREPLLEGALDERTSVSLLRGIHERLLTGRLEVSGGAARGTLYFYRGEPVAADHARGDAGMLEELERHGLVPGSLDIGFVPEGELLATLVTAGNVTGEAMHRFAGGFVRARLVDLVLRGRGRYRFVEDGRFLERAPLLRVDLPAVLAEWERSGSLPADEELAAELDEDARLREEVLTLYMRLKPLSHPRQILGVPVWADHDAVEAAYQRRLAETAPHRLPPGPLREQLGAKLEELRVKVMGAMEALRFQQRQPQVDAARSAFDDSNPF